MEDLIKKAAHLGFSNSQVFMGNKCLSEGKHAEAYRWFSRAILQRHPVATFQLAWMHHHGVGCDKSIQLAREGFLSLTELGPGANLPIAYFPLYLCYLQMGEEENALDILQRGLRNGSVDCIRVFALNSLKAGKKEQSYRLFTKAAEMGDFYSAYHVAVFPGKEKNIPLLRYAAQGYWRGAEIMGAMIMDQKIHGSWNDALGYYRQAYELISPESYGKSWLESIIWWMENSFGKGEFGLDFMDIPGLPPLPPRDHPLDDAWRCLDTLDFGGAVKSFEKCIEIEEGISEAVFNLGFLHMTGLGTEKDYIKAHEYLSQALIHFSRVLDDDLRLIRMIQGIRDVLEREPDNWPILHQVYQSEGRLEKVTLLEEKMKGMETT